LYSAHGEKNDNRPVHCTQHTTVPVSVAVSVYVQVVI